MLPDVFRVHRPKIGIVTGRWGCMTSGKTNDMVAELGQPDILDAGVLLFQPTKANRTHSGKTISRTQAQRDSIDVTQPRQILRHLTPKIQHYAIEELPFLARTPKMLAECQEVILTIRDAGCHVHWAGLFLDFRGEPFPIVEWAIKLTDRPFASTATCAKCRRAPAIYSQRLIHGHPAPWKHPLFVPDTDYYKSQGISYEARCVNCFERPGEMVPGLARILQRQRHRKS